MAIKECKIKKECKITISGNTASIDKEIYLYKNDMNIKCLFDIVNSDYVYTKDSALDNVINASKASYAQVKFKKDDIEIDFDVQETSDGKAIIYITEELTDEDTELGDYTIQIRLFDESKTSVITLPPVNNCIHIMRPIFEKVGRFTNVVDEAAVDEAIVTYSEPMEAIASDGTFAKKTWVAKEKITTAELNRMEEGIAYNNSQFKDIAKKTIVEGNKLYLVKADGTKIDKGTTLPTSSSGGGTTAITSKLNGIKIGILGDSVSAGNYHCYGSENAIVKTWHEFIADKTGAIINNVSKGGSNITTVKGDGASFIDRYINLDSDCKIILVFGGINDYSWSAGTQLGSIGDTDTTNICGALKTLCEGLINKYPTIPIGFILPYGFNEYKGSETWKPYENKIIEVLNYYGIPYLNLRTNSIMNANIEFINSKYFRFSSTDSSTGDKTHPNTAGHSIIAKPILSFIEKIYYDMYATDVPSEILPTSISIRDTLEITVGEQSTLAVTFTPSTTTNKTLTWSSSKEGVATVSNGIVTGVGQGSCNIVATTQNGKTCTCIVTVGNKSTANYVTDGLVNFWNPEGQEQQTTSWVDEIGSKSATISGLDYAEEGFENNKLKLRATLGNATDTSSLSVPFEITNNCTFEIALKYSELSNNTYKISNIFEIYESKSTSIGLRTTLKGKTNSVGNYSTLPLGSIALVKEGSNIKVVVNGIEKLSATDDTSSGEVSFVSANKSWVACNDDIYSIKIYNRSLSNDELLQNFEYYKTLI